MKVWTAMIAVLLINEVHANEVIDLDFYGTQVNWSRLQVVASVTEKIPKLIVDPDHPEYKKPGTTENPTHLTLKKKMRENLRIRLNQRIESLFYDSSVKVFELAEKDKKVRDRINQYFFEEFEAISINQEKNMFISKASLSFIGKRGFIAYLPTQFEKEEIPILSESALPTAFSGIIVDARHLDIKKAIYPKIQSDRGVDIYSPLLVRESYAIETGYVHYRKNPMDNENQAIVGKNPYMVVALGLSGKNETDLILPSNEVAKIIAHPETRKALKQCRVLILVSK